MSRTDACWHLVTAEECGQRVDRLLAGREGVPSRTFAANLAQKGLVRVEGRTVAKHHLVREGERVEWDLPLPERVGDLVPERIPLDVRYEDEHLMVISKPAGLVVHPARGHWTGTLVHALLAHSEELGTLAGEDRPGIVHRLDKDTSGLMMVAKSDQAQAVLGDQIKVRSVDRRYLTLVHGTIGPDTGLIDAPIARHPKDRLRMAVSDAPSARQAVTTFTVLERFEAGRNDDGYSLVECKLYTGRTHQIRLHMHFIDHPCVGDPVYGRRRSKAELGLERQFLHSWRIVLDHPISGEAIELVDALPADLAAALSSIEGDSRGRTEAGEAALSLLARVPPGGLRLA